MPLNPAEFDALAAQLDRLSQEQRHELLDRLARPSASTNGHAAGRTTLDGFRERGLIGSIQDAPEDLSTNPDHLRGFGSDAG